MGKCVIARLFSKHMAPKGLQFALAIECQGDSTAFARMVCNFEVLTKSFATVGRNVSVHRRAHIGFPRVFCGLVAFVDPKCVQISFGIERYGFKPVRDFLLVSVHGEGL